MDTQDNDAKQDGAPKVISSVLVTGAAGFIGGHVCERLVAKGIRVMALDDLSTGRLENLVEVLDGEGFEFREGDLLDSEFFDLAVSDFKPDAFIHLAGLVNVALAEEDPAKNFRLNVESTQRVAEAARSVKARRVVFASSAAVYGEPEALPLSETNRVSPIGQYGQAKLCSEGILEGFATSYGIETVSLRFFNVYGPRQDPKSPYSGVVSIFLDSLLAGKQATIFGDGKQSRDFVAVHDIASAVVEAATASQVESGSYNVCTGQTTDLLELYAVLAASCGTPSEPLFTDSRVGDIRDSLGSPDKAAKAFDFTAGVSLADGLDELVESVRDSPAPS